MTTKKKKKTKQEVISYSNQEKGHDDCCSSALLSSASQEPEAVLQTNITSCDCYELQSPFGNGEYYLCDRNEVSTCNEDKNVYKCIRSYVMREKKIWIHSCVNLRKKIVAVTYCSHQYTQSCEMLRIHLSYKSTSLGDTAVTNIHKTRTSSRCQSILSKKTISTDNLPFENQAPYYRSLESRT